MKERVLNKKENEIWDNFFSLQKDGKWGEAKKILLDSRDNLNESASNYLWGIYYDSYGNSEKNNDLAFDYFGKVVNSKTTFPYAFRALAFLDKNKSNTIRILKKGINVFPDDQDIYADLLRCVDKSEIDLIYGDIEDKNLLSDEIIAILVGRFYNLEKHQEIVDLLGKHLDLVKDDKMLLRCVKAFSLYELDDFTGSSNLFFELVEEDLLHKLNYLPQIGFLLNLINKRDIDELENFFIVEIPCDFEIDAVILEPNLFIDFEPYVRHVLNEIIKITKNKEVKCTARGLRGLFCFDKVADVSKPSKTLQNQVLRDLEFASNHFKRNGIFLKKIFEIYLNTLNDNSKSWNILLEMVKGSSFDSSYVEMFLDEMDETTLVQYGKNLQVFIDNTNYFDSDKISFIDKFIKKFSEKNKYSEIVDIVKSIDVTYLEKFSTLFYIAYSYSEVGDKDKAEFYYLMDLKISNHNSSTLNNLGVIYENKDDLESAKEHYENAIKQNPEKELYVKNLKRVKVSLQKKESLEKEKKLASDLFMEENQYIKMKVCDFLKFKDENSILTFKDTQLVQLFNENSEKAQAFLDLLLEKKYFFKVDEDAQRYLLNPYIEKKITKIKKEISPEVDFQRILEQKEEGISLREVGFDQKLIDELKKINKKELKLILKRDLKENAIALIFKQFKTALVLSGSIIEAILFDVISARGIKKYKINNKEVKLKDMRLNHLLMIAEKENIIESSTRKLADAVRDYRNLIHPIIEDRKKIRINEGNANIAWQTVKNLLQEI